MTQPQQPYPPRHFSPPQPSPPPGNQQYMPPAKKQRLSPNPPSHPGSPYAQSPYGLSPGGSGPQSAGMSPHFSNVQIPAGAYNTPYVNGANGHTTPSSLSLPQSQSNHHNPGPQNSMNYQVPNQSHHQTNYNNFVMPPQGAGTMGPPSKPAEKPKEDGVDVMDVLSGSGIDLREEENFTFQYQLHHNSFNSQPSTSQSGTVSSSHSFTQFPPGDEASFYGSGPANTIGESVNTKSQEEFLAKAAEKAWIDAARSLAQERSKELNNPFLEVATVHRKMERIARENGLVLNTDPSGKMGTMNLPEHFPSPTVKIQTAVGPNGAIAATHGNFLPNDSLLVDHLALMSIATKYRLRGLLEDSAKLAKGRQTGSHGTIPSEWVDAAAPSKPESFLVAGAPRSGWESAVSPHTEPLKRSFSASRIPTPVSEGTKTPTGTVKLANEVVSALRGSAIKERDLEEERLKKRAARALGKDQSRQGSVIPGTPGSVAPDPTEKPPTKKELKKAKDSKTSDAASHAAANLTTAQFLGGGGSLFGKKNKKYSWMNGGGSASGASTPGRLMTQGLPGTPAGAVVSVAPERLTVDGARRLGTWREDKEKGMGIQIRDWITVLEEDGREKKALQMAYASLDQSDPK